MSENANPLNDFLEMEENNSGMFADIPFANPAAQTVVQNTSPQAQTPVKQPVVNIAQIQNPTPNAQGSLFDNAVTQTPIAKEPTAQNHPTNAAQTIANATDPFSAALANAKAQSDSRLVDNCANRDAVFCYGKAKEPITDHDCTFEELREKYETDFPELEESKKVEWTVTYGKETKPITNPGSNKVYEIKAEIEKSKKFLDGIKKAKTDADKNPVCIVKPRIKAQSKGEIIPLSSYKEFCSTKTEAQKSDKAIVLLPSSDGRIYQMRKTPIGEFIAETDYFSEFENITPGFKMSIPKIPMHLLLFMWDFFREVN